MEEVVKEIKKNNNNNKNNDKKKHFNSLSRRRLQAYPPLLPLPPIFNHFPTNINTQVPLLQFNNFHRPFCPSNNVISYKGQLNGVLPIPTTIKDVKQNVTQNVEVTTIVTPSVDYKTNVLNSLQAIVTAKRPDHGGNEGIQISLLANHFLVKFDSSQEIFHYDTEISPCPSKEIARLIKNKLVQENRDTLYGANPVFDGRRSLFSAIEFQNNCLEFFVSLPIQKPKSLLTNEIISSITTTKPKVFRVNMRLVSKLTANDLNKYLKEEEGGVPLPQDYLHALDVVLRESSMENSYQVGRCLYSNSMEGKEDIGGGATGLRGFFQSLRPTQQGLALNVDLSVMAFHESIGIIQYLQKRCDFLKDLSCNKTRRFTMEEKQEVENVLKNIRIFVCHRETSQRYRVFSLTEETTENLKFRDRDGSELKVMDYFKDQYNHEIKYWNLPCLQISRSKPCYLPMELCVVCEGQKFMGKLSENQTAKILKMGCQKPGERKDAINGIVNGDHGPTSSKYLKEFNLQVSKEMTEVGGRVLQPPKLKFGDGGIIKDMTPNRHDRQWNLHNTHVAEGSKIKRWTVICFGGTFAEKSSIPRFLYQLPKRCNQLGIALNNNTIVSPSFEPIQTLNNASHLESKLRKIYETASCNLQLLICVMEKKHKGYADLKRISETKIGVVSQCCLYSNLSKPNPQFLASIALKINAKLGGCNTLLYNTLPCQIPRLFREEEPVILMGADVTHPHPIDDSSPSVVAVVGSMNWPAANKYISRMRSQTHRQEIIEALETMVKELLEEFLVLNSKLPCRIIFFRDGVSESQFYKVLEVELRAIRSACSKFKNYKPFITFLVVQKRHHTRLFINGKKKNNYEENIPPGTVVDKVITHPREFDFFLCSHWGMKGTSRPTHYHVLWDENAFKSDELQKLIHNLCYTFVRCTKPVSLVPPAYYAHLAAYRGRLYIDRSDHKETNYTLSRASPLVTSPLPKLADNVKRLMFYC